MGFYDNEENVLKYIQMSKDYDGRELYEKLKIYLKTGSTFLELGMGEGKDIDIFRRSYKVTGSDNSKVFIDLYKNKNEDADVILLDAVTLDTNRKFNCIYSNKVLQHLTQDELEKSIENQFITLEDDGLIFHTFWYGTGFEDYDGLKFVYYTEEELKSKFCRKFDILEINRYTESEKDDSIYIVARKITF